MNEEHRKKRALVCKNQNQKQKTFKAFINCSICHVLHDILHIVQQLMFAKISEQWQIKRSLSTIRKWPTEEIKGRLEQAEDKLGSDINRLNYQKLPTNNKDEGT